MPFICASFSYWNQVISTGRNSTRLGAVANAASRGLTCRRHLISAADAFRHNRNRSRRATNRATGEERRTPSDLAENRLPSAWGTRKYTPGSRPDSNSIADTLLNSPTTRDNEQQQQQRSSSPTASRHRSEKSPQVVAMKKIAALDHKVTSPSKGAQAQARKKTPEQVAMDEFAALERRLGAAPARAPAPPPATSSSRKQISGPSKAGLLSSKRPEEPKAEECCGNGCATCVWIGYCCLYGTYCYNNDQCQRKLPEFRGYAAPSIGVILGVVLVGSTALFCGIAGISIAREFAKESAATRRREAIREAAVVASNGFSGRLAAAEPSGNGRNGNDCYLTLAGDADDDTGALIGGSGSRGSINVFDPSATEEDEEEEAAVPTVPNGKKDYGRRGGPRRVRRGGGRRSRSRAAALAAAAQLGPSPFARKVSFYTRMICGTGLAVTLILCGVVVTFAPHPPGVNVCNTEFDWGSIVHSIKADAPSADFQLLVSIYNPNILDAKIERGTATLNHERFQVGTMTFQPAVLAGGYVVDLLLTITFQTEAWTEARLAYEYETGQLAFLMDATISASVMWHGISTYPFTFSINNYYIKVSDTTDYDRSLCNCTQMMQGALHRQQPEHPLLLLSQQPLEQQRRRRSRRLPFAESEGGSRAGSIAAEEVLLPPAMGDVRDDEERAGVVQ